MSAVIRMTDRSRGVHHTMFTSVRPEFRWTAARRARYLQSRDPGVVNPNTVVRRVEPRNAPTVINAVFNF